MTIKLKDWHYEYFKNTDIAVKFVNDFSHQFKSMPRLLDINISREEYLRIVDFFYQIEEIKNATPDEIYSFLKSELTEKRIRKDIFTTRNRINKAIQFVRLWYLSKEIEKVEKRLATLEEYDSTFNEDLEVLKDISDSLIRKRRKES